MGTDDGDHEGHDGSAHEVVLVTHESFVMPDELVAQFEEESGYDLVLQASGDAGALTNKLVLTKDNPIGDVVFGIDNTFAQPRDRRGRARAVRRRAARRAPRTTCSRATTSRRSPRSTTATSASTSTTPGSPPRASRRRRPSRTSPSPAYQDLFVTPGATTSSPGLAFLLATIAEYGDDWPDYWTRLLDNGAKLTEGWTDAYQVDFTQGGGGGDRPIVLSYDSSPAFTVDGEGGTTTSALLDTCFRQVEYAGVLAGAENPEGAEALVDFMLGPRTSRPRCPRPCTSSRSTRPSSCPRTGPTFAVQPETPYAVDPAEIAANRDDWLSEWSDVTSR